MLLLAPFGGTDGPRLRLVLGPINPVGVQNREDALRFSMTMSSREAIQSPRLRLVLGSATPVPVH